MKKMLKFDSCVPRQSYKELYKKGEETRRGKNRYENIITDLTG